MMKATTRLDTLGEEYIVASEMLRGRIGKLREEIKTAKGRESVILSKRITELYKQSFDLRNTGYDLKNYYKKRGADIH